MAAVARDLMETMVVVVVGDVEDVVVMVEGSRSRRWLFVWERMLVERGGRHWRERKYLCVRSRQQEVPRALRSMPNDDNEGRNGQ